jgi:hypothetical protein
MSCHYNALSNVFSQSEEEAQPPRKHVPTLLPFITTAKFNQVYSALQQVSDAGADTDDRVTILEDIDVIQNQQLVVLTDDITNIQEDYTNVQADQGVQDTAIATLQDSYNAVQAEQTLQNTAIDVLQDGVLHRVHYEEAGLGGAHLLFTPGQEVIDSVTGVAGITPSTAALETYDASGVIGSSITLQGPLITMSKDVKVEGELILNEKSVADQLLSLEDKAKQYVIELSVNTALDLAQDAAIAALAAYSARPPSNYEKLPEDTGESDTDDRTSLNPFALYPTGIYNQLPDSLGNIPVPVTVTKGKVSLNLGHDLCYHTFHMRGDLKQEHQDPDDEIEFESPCRLGSKVAVYNTSNVLQNSGTVAVRLATNSLVTVGGQIQAAEIVVDSVKSAKVNGTNVVRTLHVAQGLSSRDVRRDIAIQSIRVSSALREATKPDAVSKDLRRDIAIQSIRISAALRLARIPVVSKDYQSDIQRLRDEAAYDRRDLFRPSPISKNYDLVVAQLKSRVAVQTKPRAPVTSDYSPKLSRLSNGIVNVQRSVKAVYSSSYTAVVNILRGAISVIRQDVRVLKTRKNVVVADPRPALGRVNDRVSALQRLVTNPVLSKSYDKQIATLRGATVASSDAVSGVRRLIKASVSTDSRPAVKRVNERVTGLQRLVKPVFSASYTAVVNVLKAALSVIRQDVRVLKTRKQVLVSDSRPALKRTNDRVTALQRLVRPSIIQDTGRKAVELYKRQLAAATSAITTGLLTVDHLFLSFASSSIAGLSTDTTIPTGQTWIRVGYFYYRFSGDIRIRICSNDSTRVFDQVTLSLDYNRSQGDGALDFQATLKHSNAYFNDRGISRVAITNLDYASFRNHSVYFLGPSGYSYDLSVSAVPYGSNPTSDEFFLDKPPVYESPTVATYVTYFECKQRTDFAGSVNFQNGVISQKSLTCNSGIALSGGQLNFGSRTGSLINLWGSGNYTIGIQGGTQYFRTDQHVAWFKGGTHSDTTLDSGGGNTIAYLDGNAYEMYLRGGTGNYTKVVRSTKNIVMSGNVGAANQSSGSINFGITFTSPPIVTLQIDDAGGTVNSIYVAGRTTTGCSWSSSGSGTSNRSINWAAFGNSTQ